MMKEHPHSVWTLGGIPGGNLGVPSPADLESWGATWKGVSDEYLIGVAARQHGGDITVSMPALIESQRRLKGAIASFDESMEKHSEALARSVEDSSRQTARLVDLTQETSAQTERVIELTRVMKRLTVVIAWLTVAAAFFAGIQAIAILVHFYRWYRGWL
jgi:hypothetical protein